MVRPPSLRDRLWAVYLAATTPGIVVFLLMGEGVRPWWFDALSLSAAVTLVFAVKVGRFPRPLPWLLIAGSQLASFAGDLVYDLLAHVWHRQPFPSVADLAYLCSYLLLGAALLIVIRHRAPRRNLADLIDATIISVGAGVVGWIFLVVPSATDSSASPFQRALSAAYPAADLLVLALLIRLALTPGVRSGAYRLLGLGVVAYLLADTGYAGAVLLGSPAASSPLLEMVWLVGYALMSAAALHPSAACVDVAQPVPSLTLSAQRLALLAAASIVAPIVLAVQSIAHMAVEALVLAGASIVLSLLVLLRMLGLLRQVQRSATLAEALAETDGLTGALNRRCWDRRLPQELARAARSRLPVCVALLDLDHFKQFNDTYGHPAGDDLLRQVTRRWQARVRPTDLLARYGGEEFGLIVPTCFLPDATALVEELTGTIPEGQTCSVGVVQWNGSESPEELIGRADRALYRAKRNGRNRIEADEWFPLGDGREDVVAGHDAGGEVLVGVGRTVEPV